MFLTFEDKGSVWGEDFMQDLWIVHSKVRTTDQRLQIQDRFSIKSGSVLISFSKTTSFLHLAIGMLVKC